jgi:hypothetical protein
MTTTRGCALGLDRCWWARLQSLDCSGYHGIGQMELWKMDPEKPPVLDYEPIQPGSYSSPTLTSFAAVLLLGAAEAGAIFGMYRSDQSDFVRFALPWLVSPGLSCYILRRSGPVGITLALKSLSGLDHRDGRGLEHIRWLTARIARS